MKALILLYITICFAIDLVAQDNQFVISAPAGDRPAKIDKDGKTVIPNGRILTPTGKCVTVAPHPYGLTF